MSGFRGLVGAAAISGMLLGVACREAPDGGAGDPAGSDAARGTMPPGGATAAAPERFGFGRPPTAEQIAAWDRDVGPDGAGLPAGSGSVGEGLAVYAAKCAACHGADGTGGPNDQLTGRIPGDSFPFATDASARSTVGSYWPYATTLFDYVRKAMPFDAPGTLTDGEVYAVVGAVLYFNDLVAGDAVLDSATVTNLEMPARDRFVPDDRSGGAVIR
jgi:cytochrome c